MIVVMAQKHDIQEQLRQAILGGALNRRALSKVCGVSEAQLSYFVRGLRSLTLDSAAKVARVLKLELKPVRESRKAR
jgi:plasmid maintenance system antidote protein VapI